MGQRFHFQFVSKGFLRRKDMLSMQIAVHKSDSGSAAVQIRGHCREFGQTQLVCCVQPAVAGNNLIFLCCTDFPNKQWRQNPILPNALTQELHFLVVLHMVGIALEWVDIRDGNGCNKVYDGVHDAPPLF